MNGKLRIFVVSGIGLTQFSYSVIRASVQADSTARLFYTVVTVYVHFRKAKKITGNGVIKKGLCNGK